MYVQTVSLCVPPATTTYARNVLTVVRYATAQYVRDVPLLATGAVNDIVPDAFGSVVADGGIALVAMKQLQLMRSVRAVDYYSRRMIPTKLVPPLMPKLVMGQKFQYLQFLMIVCKHVDPLQTTLYSAGNANLWCICQIMLERVRCVLRVLRGRYKTTKTTTINRRDKDGKTQWSQATTQSAM